MSIHRKNLGLTLTAIKCSKCTQNKDEQEGAELCQAQPAKHKLFGSNGAFFWFEVLTVEMLNCWIAKLENC